jgi:glycosyltransferase involved in cell wall biosynthesis
VVSGADSEKQKELSIVIRTYKRYHQPIRALQVLTGQILTHQLASSIEVILVDDANEPAIGAQLEQHIAAQRQEFLRYVRMAKHSGASGASNVGAEASRGKLIAFLDDDIVPGDDYVSATINVHRRHPDALVINGNLLPLRTDVYSRFWFYYYDAVFNRPGKQFYPVKMLASGHVSIKRRLLELENPLFDVSLTAREDYDLYLRLEKRSIRIYKDDSIIAFNDCRGTMYGFLKQRLWYGQGEQQLMAKHGATFIKEKSKDYHVPPNTKFWYLYLVLRITRGTTKLWAKTRQSLGRLSSAIFE